MRIQLALLSSMYCEMLVLGNNTTANGMLRKVLAVTYTTIKFNYVEKQNEGIDA